MEETHRPFWKQCDTPRDRRNQVRVLGWMFAWMGTWLGVNAAISYDWLPPGAPAIAATALPTLIGLGMLLAYRRFLVEADELRRKIELEALALAFGIGLVAGLSYWLLERAGGVAEVDLLSLVVLMIFIYGAGVLFGQRRYS